MGMANRRAFKDFLNPFTIIKYPARIFRRRRKNLLKQRIVKEYARDFSASTFVETGTYKGDMLKAVKDSFTKIYSIEFDRKLYEKAQRKFRKYGHISLIYGDSGEVIPEAADMFWLDAHYSGGMTAKSFPIMKELARISSFSVILIDDARKFTGQDYPHIEKVKDFVFKKWPKSTFNIKDDIIRITA